MLKDLLDDWRERGLVAQITHEEELREQSELPTAYCGFDPTAPSLHVGHLLPVMSLSRWQRAGGRIIVLMGGGTAMIGDPTGKTEMRKVLTLEEIDANIANFVRQTSGLLNLSDPKKGIIVNNADWLMKLSYLPFLREIGTHFSVNRMLTAECFRSRMEHGLSFVEFNYMLLQSYDFLHLQRTESCTMQLGGDDQWSNMLAGVELVRRVSHARAFCVTFPLLATSDGRKMGKTEKGAVWLDAEQTTPYDYFQFWRNLPDELIERCLKQFTFLPVNEIKSQLAETNINETKVRLAYEATAILHGEDAARNAKDAAAKLFSNDPASAAANAPTAWIELGAGQVEISVVDALVAGEIAPSKGEARRLADQGGVFLVDLDRCATAKEMFTDKQLKAGVLLRKGKKHYYYLRIR